MNWNEIKSIVQEAVAKEQGSLNELSQAIWKNPELNFNETKAHAVLTDFLEKRGFAVQRNYHIDTAFRAEFVSPAGSGETTICVMCEYDALPEIGHACGHNLISEAGIGAAVAIKTAMEKKKEISGKLVVMGTPAEEGGGGKIILINAGALDDIDFAMMAHPTRFDALYCKFLAVQEVIVTFYGKEAHASASPWEGINALDAAVAAYANIGLCRQQFQPTWRVHGIITKGGVKPNIIPGETEMEFLVRAPTLKELEVLKGQVINCFEAAAKSSGCKMEYKIAENSNYDSMLLNGPMLEAYRKFAEEKGTEFIVPPFTGSTDMGNVSQKKPSIHPMFSIPTQAVNHTKEFTTAAGDPSAQPSTLKTAECLALTAIQLFTDAKLRKESREAFQEGEKISFSTFLETTMAKAFDNSNGKK